MDLIEFPEFKLLELADKLKIQQVIGGLAPHSDYNFASIYCYDTKGKILWSTLNGNIVMIFTDYTSDDVFITFYGNRQVVSTAQLLLDFAKINDLPQELRMIHEDILTNNKDLEDLYELIEDRNNFDYILSTENLSRLAGNKLRGKRNLVNRFKKFHPNHTVEILNLQDKAVVENIIDLFRRWELIMGKTRAQSNTEFVALTRFIDSSSHFDILGVGVYVGGSMIGFSLIEKSGGPYATIHFEKADINFIGIYQYMKNIVGDMLYSSGIPYINYEQDLGLETLRIAKSSWQPVRLLKKYILRQAIRA